MSAARKDENTDSVIAAVKKHLEEKYGKNGYLKLWLNSPRNLQGLNTIRTWLENGAIGRLIEENLHNK